MVAGCARLTLWRRRMRERAELARLTDVELRDIGVTPSEAWYESRKPLRRA